MYQQLDATAGRQAIIAHCIKYQHIPVEYKRCLCSAGHVDRKLSLYPFLLTSADWSPLSNSAR